MKIEIIKESKDEVELTIDNLTVAEVLRAYLYENGAEFAAWRREHPSKPVLFKIKAGSGKSVKKVVADSVEAIKKDCDKIVSGLKK